MASYIFSKLPSPNKPVTPNKPRIEIEKEDDVKTPPIIVDVYDSDNDDDVFEEVGDDVEEVGDDVVEEVGDEFVDDFCDNPKNDLNEVCPCVGRLFDSLDEAEMFYRDYGRRVGFEVIIRTTHRRVKTRDIWKILKKWEVTLVDLKHNHKMISKDEVHFMQRPRNITPVIRQLIVTLNRSSIGLSKTLNVLRELTGGLENIRFGSQDVRNVLRNIRHYVFDSTDASEGLALLRELKGNSQCEFFYKVDVDEENRVRVMLWVDPRSLNAYQNFGDVVVFYSTYRTNRYCMPFVPFTGNWLEAIGNKAPQTIITDQDIAIGNAIAEVLPNTNHLFYRWEALVEKYDLMNHSWLQNMYSIRHKWVHVYTKLHFTTGMTTTSRSESMNSFFDEFVNASTGLKEFIENSQKALEKQYLREREADYETKNKERSKIKSSSLENHAEFTYTKEMFRHFQHELKESGAYVVIEKESNAIYKHYEAYKTTIQEEYRKYYVLIVTENAWWDI
ncbi:protein FAR1-RELATED SEQUENCE 5-like [Daucus carota subsp. sativus]|uniref:protein FAR1-RELATED SEQUENCE 5-like n=1 Tax=Daucus carota subsp. sativus TaxID=79200 RepID=UPI0007EF629D|nr:PREDICTED: protein FAR1-RELATED SEQUENCE 5-like [Daucus carota subsp. sativus]